MHLWNQRAVVLFICQNHIVKKWLLNSAQIGELLWEDSLPVASLEFSHTVVRRISLQLSYGRKMAAFFAIVIVHKLYSCSESCSVSAFFELVCLHQVQRQSLALPAEVALLDVWGSSVGILHTQACFLNKTLLSPRVLRSSESDMAFYVADLGSFFCPMK